MKTKFLLAVVLLLTAPFFAVAETAPDAAELTKLLQDFLAGAGRNDVAGHERFWADDLIYTSSAGNRTDKASILREVRADGPPKADAETTTYSAEDIRIQQYGDTAIVAFRLVAKTEDKGTTSVSNYFNTGTFLKRDGRWQAVAWQATVIPKKESTTPAATSTPSARSMPTGTPTLTATPAR